MEIRMVWTLLGLLALTACDQSKTHQLNLLCKPESVEQGGPMGPNGKVDPNEVVGMSILGNDVTFTGSPHFNFPIGQWKAQMCPDSKYSNVKLIHFDNLGCINNFGEVSERKTNIMGQYDFITKEMAILSVGNYKCSEVK
jgi:hypothetical protein